MFRHHAGDVVAAFSSSNFMSFVYFFLITTTTLCAVHCVPHSDDAVDDSECATTISLPICAFNGIENVIYPNKCFWQNAQRDNQLNRILPLVVCLKSCDFNCINVFEPLCVVHPGSRKRVTFKNKCEMLKDACKTEIDWEFFRTGVCNLANKKEYSKKTMTIKPKTRNANRTLKPIPCPKIFNPVCGVLADVRSTFINECLVNAENVRTGKDWQILSRGVCPEDYTDFEYVRTKPEGHHIQKRDTQTSSDGVDLGKNVEYIQTPPVFRTEIFQHDDQGIVRRRQIALNNNYKLIRRSFLPGNAADLSGDSKVDLEDIAFLNSFERNGKQHQANMKQYTRQAPRHPEFNQEAFNIGEISRILQEPPILGDNNRIGFSLPKNPENGMNDYQDQTVKSRSVPMAKDYSSKLPIIEMGTPPREPFIDHHNMPPYPFPPPHMFPPHPLMSMNQMPPNFMPPHMQPLPPPMMPPPPMYPMPPPMHSFLPKSQNVRPIIPGKPKVPAKAVQKYTPPNEAVKSLYKYETPEVKAKPNKEVTNMKNLFEDFLAQPHAPGNHLNKEALQQQKHTETPMEALNPRLMHNQRISQCKFGPTPVCGSSDDATLSFRNICDLLMHNVLYGENWQILHHGSCDNCNLNCTKRYEPLCVQRNGLEYTLDNECLFHSSICMEKKSDWKILHKGTCKGSEKLTVNDDYESSTKGFPFTSGLNYRKAYDTTISSVTTPLSFESATESIKHVMSTTSGNVKTQSRERPQIKMPTYFYPQSPVVVGNDTPTKISLVSTMIENPREPSKNSSKVIPTTTATDKNLEESPQGNNKTENKSQNLGSLKGLNQTNFADLRKLNDRNSTRYVNINSNLTAIEEEKPSTKSEIDDDSPLPESPDVSHKTKNLYKNPYFHLIHPKRLPNANAHVMPENPFDQYVDESENFSKTIDDENPSSLSLEADDDDDDVLHNGTPESMSSSERLSTSQEEKESENSDKNDDGRENSQPTHSEENSRFGKFKSESLRQQLPLEFLNSLNEQQEDKKFITNIYISSEDHNTAAKETDNLIAQQPKVKDGNQDSRQGSTNHKLLLKSVVAELKNRLPQNYAQETDDAEDFKKTESSQEIGEDSENFSIEAFKPSFSTDSGHAFDDKKQTIDINSYTHLNEIKKSEKFIARNKDFEQSEGHYKSLYSPSRRTRTYFRNIDEAEAFLGIAKKDDAINADNREEIVFQFRPKRTMKRDAEDDSKIKRETTNALGKPAISSAKPKVSNQILTSSSRNETVKASNPQHKLVLKTPLAATNNTNVAIPLISPPLPPPPPPPPLPPFPHPNLGPINYQPSMPLPPPIVNLKPVIHPPMTIMENPNMPMYPIPDNPYFPNMPPNAFPSMTNSLDPTSLSGPKVHPPPLQNSSTEDEDETTEEPALSSIYDIQSNKSVIRSLIDIYQAKVGK